MQLIMKYLHKSFLLILLCFYVFPAVSQTRLISALTLEDKIYASWLGQIIGNIYGLPHENAYIEEPGPESFPYGYGRNLKRLEELNGGYSDDDTDFEYIYLLQMEKYGVEPSYAQLTEAWKYHIRDKVWLANRAALGLMHTGITPPATGMKDYNPHWFQIDPQLINEIWAVTAPGMVGYAVAKSEWAARITNDDWGVEPTMFYGAMYSAAFFENNINKLIETATKCLPEDGRFRKAIADAKDLHKKYPNDWKAARQEFSKLYYHNEPEETRTIWNSVLNGGCAVLALLYGNGDFQLTLDLACAIGFDADNQTATLCGLFGVMNGTKGLPKDLLYPIEGWDLPFNDIYKNVTRHDMPDGKLTDMAARTKMLTEKIILKNGGRKDGDTYIINTKSKFYPPVEFAKSPAPILHRGEEVNYKLIVSGNIGNAKWSVEGKLPQGLTFSDGVFSGVPTETGLFSVTVTLSTQKEKASQQVPLRIRPENLAFSSAKILTNVPVTNDQVRDSMWYSFGKALYAQNVDVIKDGKYRGEHSVYYTILNNYSNPKVDYLGYQWKEKQNIGAIGFHIGAMEENGGWFSSLNVQYMDEDGYWRAVSDLSITPKLSDYKNVFVQPHFVEYFITFSAVSTNAIRIIGDATLVEHWHKNSNNVSPFISVTELSVYNPF